MAKAKLVQAIEHENKLREKFMDLVTDTDIMDLLCRQSDIDDQKEELAQITHLYDMVVRRIEEIEFEQERPARISIAQRASSVPANNCRKGMSIGAVAMGLLLGVLFAGLPGRKKVK